MTYKIDIEKNRIAGYCSGREEIQQAVYKILMTERYRYLIYHRRYGVELEDLFGMPADYVCAVLGRRIKEALTQDNRISDVKDFSFHVEKSSVRAYFTVVSRYGEDKEEFVF